MKTTATLIAIILSTAAAYPGIAGAQIPSSGIGPAPTGVVPGGVVPVPPPNTTPTPNLTPVTPDLTPPGPILPAAPNLTPPTPFGVNTVPGLPGQRPNGTATINTFTEQQVRSNLMAQGYSGVSGLTVDGSGTWRGTAVRNGGNVGVSVDSNGMVTPH